MPEEIPELLDLLGLDAKTLASLSPALDDMEQVRAALVALDSFLRIPPNKAADWARQSRVNGDAARGSLGELVGNFLYVSGVVVEAKVIPIPPDVGKGFTNPRLARCLMKVSNFDESVTLLSQDVPRAWLNDSSLAQPASAIALVAGTTEHPVLICRRVAWHPAKGVGRLGMDLGLFDLVTDHTSLTVKEREYFYELMSTIKLADPATLDALATKDAKITPLFNEPANSRGKIVTLSGHVARMVPVHVDEADVRNRFGIDHYWEIELITPDSQRNPLVFCVPVLPKELPQENYKGLSLRITGVFLKSWAFTPGGDSKSGERVRRLAPLLIGGVPRLLPTPSAIKADRGLIAIIAITTIVSGVLVALIAIRISRQQARVLKNRSSRGIDL